MVCHVMTLYLYSNVHMSIIKATQYFIHHITSLYPNLVNEAISCLELGSMV